MTAPSKRSLWIVAGLLAVVAVVLYRRLGLGELLTLDSLKASRDTLTALYADRPLFTVTAFFGLYVVATALSFPGATILTLAAGAMFGLGVGLVVVSFASSLGALRPFWWRVTCFAMRCNRASANSSARSTRAWRAMGFSTC